MRIQLLKGVRRWGVGTGGGEERENSMNPFEEVGRDAGEEFGDWGGGERVLAKDERDDEAKMRKRRRTHARKRSQVHPRRPALVW